LEIEKSIHSVNFLSQFGCKRQAGAEQPHGFPAQRHQEARLFIACRDQKAVKFRVKIDPSTQKKLHHENITFNSIKT
jgi:hypothetical protein